MNNDIDSRDENKQTPLMHAVYKNDAEMVKSLLRQGANSLLKDNKYCSVLMYAVKYADPQIVQYISDDIKYRIGIEQKRTDGPKKKHRIRDVINVYDIYGKNALIYAIMRGNLEIVKILLSFHGIWVNIYDERNGLTPLMYAILQLETRNPRDYNEYIKIIYLLLQHGAHVNEKDKNYKSVLMYACQYGDADLVKEILARMNDGVILKKDNKNAAILNIINNTDSQKNYALMCAVRHGNVDIVKLLLGYDIRINIVDKNGLTPIMYALESGNDEMVNLLLDAGVDLWRCDYDEHDVFYYIENSLLELPEPTISRIKKLYNTFTTQLEIALAYIKSNDVTALENWCGVYKGLINREINGKTLLMHATEMKKTQCVDVLTKRHGGQNNKRNKKMGMIPGVQYAFRQTEDFAIETIRDQLSKHKTRDWLNETDKNGKTVMDLVWEKRWWKLRDMLDDLLSPNFNSGFDITKNKTEMIEFAKRIMFNSSEKQRIVYRELLKNYCTPLDLDNPKALVLADNVSQLKIVISQNKSFDINKPDALGRTLIMYAHSVEMVEYLLSQGADVTLHDKFEKTALDYANDKTRGIILAQVNYLALKQNSIEKIATNQGRYGR